MFSPPPSPSCWTIYPDYTRPPSLIRTLRGPALLRALVTMRRLFGFCYSIGNLPCSHGTATWRPRIYLINCKKKKREEKEKEKRGRFAVVRRDTDTHVRTCKHTRRELVCSSWSSVGFYDSLQEEFRQCVKSSRFAKKYIYIYIKISITHPGIFNDVLTLGKGNYKHRVR